MDANTVSLALGHVQDELGEAIACIEKSCELIDDIRRVIQEWDSRPPNRESAMTRRGNPRIAKDAVATFLDRVDRGDEVAKAVLSLVEECGLTINATGAGTAIRCTQLLERMYLQDAELLSRTLRTVARAWDRQSVSLRGDVIEGVAMFYVEAETADEDHLVTVLRTITVPDLLRRTEGNGRRRKMAELFADLYTSHQTLF